MNGNGVRVSILRDAVVPCVGDQQVAGPVDREPSRPLQLGAQGDGAVAGEAGIQAAGDRRDATAKDEYAPPRPLALLRRPAPRVPR